MTAVLLLTPSHALAVPPAPDVALAEIRKAYAEGRDRDAILLADQALQEGVREPGGSIAEVHFWRGAALRRLGRVEEALLAFQAAARLGFSAPELHLERALALSAVGRATEAQSEIDEALTQTQEDPARLSGLEERWKSRTEEGTKRFEVRFRPEAGLDTNIFLVNENTLLLNENQGRESPYYGGVLSARYWIVEGGREGTALSLEYQNTLRAYAEEPDLSYADNQVLLTGRLPLGSRTDFELGISASDAFLTEDRHLRTLRSFQPAVLIRPLDRVQVRLWGEWADYDSYLNAPDEQDRDATYQRAGVSATFDVGGGWGVTPFFNYIDYKSEGSDFVHHEVEPGISVAAPELLGIQASVRLAWTAASFDNPNSLTGFTVRREDRRTTASITLRFPALERLAGYAPGFTIGFQDWSSNVEAYDFDRWDLRFDVSILAVSF
jgi:tetratricopeptide (TPR) repeat protein